MPLNHLAPPVVSIGGATFTFVAPTALLASVAVLNPGTQTAKLTLPNGQVIPAVPATAVQTTATITGPSVPADGGIWFATSSVA